MKSATALPPVDQGRRDFLRMGMTGTLVLSTVSLSAMLAGCASAPPATGFRVLRAADIAVLRALMPVVLAGAMPTDDSRERVLDESVSLLDGLLAASSRAGQQQVHQLFDLMAFGPTRRLVVGLDKEWDKASPAEIDAFLTAWSRSRFDMLRAAYIALTQMITMNWYLQPRAWAAINYVPPRVVG